MVARSPRKKLCRRLSGQLTLYLVVALGMGDFRVILYVAGLKIIFERWSVVLTGQTNFSSVMSRFWPVKILKILILKNFPIKPKISPQYSARYSDFNRPHTCRTNVKNFRFCFKVLEYALHYLSTSKMSRLLLYSSTARSDHSYSTNYQNYLVISRQQERKRQHFWVYNTCFESAITSCISKTILLILTMSRVLYIPLLLA